MEHSLKFTGVLVFVACLLACGPDEPLPKMGQRDVDDQGNEIIHQVDDFTFIDHNGNTYSNKESNNAILVMNTFFTSCPTICPKMTDNLLPVFDKYQNASDVNFVSASVDPVADTPARLSQFMLSHDIPLNDNWHFVTGDKKKLYDFARYQLYLSAMEVVDDVKEDFIHSEKVVLIDQDRYIRGFYTGTDPSQMKQLAKDIKRLRKEH